MAILKQPSLTKVNCAKETVLLDVITLVQVLGLTYGVVHIIISPCKGKLMGWLPGLAPHTNRMSSVSASLWATLPSTPPRTLKTKNSVQEK